MVSTFWSLAASPLPRVMLLMATKVQLDDAGKLTGSYLDNAKWRHFASPVDDLVIATQTFNARCSIFVNPNYSRPGVGRLPHEPVAEPGSTRHRRRSSTCGNEGEVEEPPTLF